MINTIYFNAVIYSVDEHNTFYDAMMVQDGFITAMNSNDEILKLQSESTKLVDMKGAFIMPGLIDAHLHPFWGASQFMSCDLRHRILTKDEVLQQITQYTQDQIEHPDHNWIIARGWMQPDMLPKGSQLTRHDLDEISTELPIVIFSNDCHLLVCNSLALQSFTTVIIPENSLDNGILEDSPAMQAFDEITRYSDKYALKVAKNAQYLLNQEGITTVMDARADAITLKAFKTLSDSDALTLRVLGAKEIPAASFATENMIADAVAETAAFMAKFSAPQKAIKPTTTVLHIKFFIDGVLQEPLHTALLREPYQGIALKNHYGDCYYDKALLTALLTETNKLGWHPHMHTVADSAIDFALDCLEDSLKNSPNSTIRPSLAHNELTAPDHYARFAKLKVMATQSLQWAAMDEETHQTFVGLLGEERIKGFECAGKFYDAGVKVAYGSDWPIDHLDVWSNFQVGMKRQLMGDSFKHKNDRDLTVYEILRSATIDAAYMLQQEDKIGSLEIGKFADFIVLNKNPFQIERKHLHTITANLLFLGGKNINLR